MWALSNIREMIDEMDIGRLNQVVEDHVDRFADAEGELNDLEELLRIAHYEEEEEGGEEGEEEEEGKGERKGTRKRRGKGKRKRRGKGKRIMMMMM